MCVNRYVSYKYFTTRNYCVDVHSMGTRSLRSRQYWRDKVSKWRKKEPYVALGRHLLGFDPGYKQWDCFRFEDFRIRSMLIRTFEVRHLPLSDGRDGDNFGGTYTFDWAKHHYEPPKRKSKAETYVKKEPRPPTSTEQRPAQRMVFDVELGKLVPL